MNMSTTAATDAEAAIRAAGPGFIRAFNAGDADAVARYYSDDAVFLAPNAPIAKGMSGVRDAFRAFLTSVHPTLSFTPDRIVQSCDMAYEYGHYTTQSSAGNDTGNYLTVWRRMPNGDWKIVADSVNSSMPMPGMAH
jgi:ketosteroid isomerase-like protein